MKEIVYKCDMCGAIINLTSERRIVKIPRICRYYATDAKGVKLMPFEKVEILQGHLCTMCVARMASLLPVIEE